MRPEITFRHATPADLPVLLSFEQGIVAAERPCNPLIKEGDIHYYDIAAMIESEQVAVIVAEDEGELVASGYARIVESKPFKVHDQHAYLGFMYVRPSHRGQGLVAKIIEALKAFARSRGLTHCYLEVYHNNDPAVRAYEKAGFKKEVLLMRSEL